MRHRTKNDQPRLEDTTERKRSEQGINLLLTITEAIAESKDLQAALTICLHHVCAATGWILGQAWVPGQTGLVLECSPAWYAEEAGLETFREASEFRTFEKGAGLVGRVWETGQPIWVPDLRNDTRYLRAAGARSVGLQAAMLIPVLSSNEVVAVLEFMGFEARKEDERLVELVSAIATQLGSVIQRKRAEEALRISEERFRLAVDNIPDTFVIYDAARRFQFVNARGVHLSGYSVEQIIGRTDEELFPDKVTAGYLPALKLAVETRTPQTVECNLPLPSGTFIIAATYIPLLDENGEIRQILGITHDITRRRQAEDALRDSEERFRQIADNIAEVFYVHDVGLTDMLYVSPAYEKIWGRTCESVYNDVESFIRAIHLEDRQRVADAKRVILRGERREEYRVIRPDGSMRWVRDRAFPVTDHSGEVYLVTGLAEDITEQRQLGEQLRQSQKLEAVGRLAGGVAHDFNNLLTAILGYSQLLLKSVPPTNSLHRMVNEIHRAGERAASLTTQLLAYSRRQMLQPKVFNLNDVVADLNKMLKQVIGEHVNLVTVPDPNLGYVKADPGQIEQVILNLAVNARDAMPGGGNLTVKTFNVEIESVKVAGRHPVPPGEYVLLTVIDTGCGMDPDTCSKIFEPFFTTKELGKGTGLGLAMVYGIVKQSGGHILVDSEVGRGSTFRIFLPRATDAPDVKDSRTGTQETPRGSETILLVEDEPSVQLLAAVVLRKLGYTVLEASNGAEALRLVEREPSRQIDLLLTDVVMPKVGGREMAARLAMTRPNLRVLYMSGYTDETLFDQDESGLRAGFLQKPFSPHDLGTKIRQTLDQ